MTNEFKALCKKYIEAYRNSKKYAMGSAEWNHYSQIAQDALAQIDQYPNGNQMLDEYLGY